MGTMINITDDSFQEIFLDFIRESFKENYNSYEYCSIAKIGNTIVFSPQNSDVNDCEEEEKEKTEQKIENKKTLFLVTDASGYSDRGVPVKLTDEQRKAIVWLITELDLDVTIHRIDDSKIKEI